MQGGQRADRIYERGEKAREREKQAMAAQTPLRVVQIQAILLERERTRARIAEEETKKAQIALETLKAKNELEKVRLQRMQATEASKTRREALRLRREENAHNRDQEKELLRLENEQRRRERAEDDRQRQRLKDAEE